MMVPSPEARTLRSGRVEINGFTLGVDSAHDDRDVAVLVHGWLGDRSLMRPLAAQLATTMDVVSLDLRGHGESDLRPGAGYRIADFAGDVWALCETLGDRHAFLVGHSMGGAVVSEVGARSCKPVVGIILLDAPWVFEPAPQGAHELARRLVAEPYEQVVRECIGAGERPEPASTVMSSVAREVAVESFTSLMDWADDDGDRPFTLPVLAIFPTGSPAATAVEGAHRPGVGVARIEDVGHYLQLEVPAVVAGLVTDFAAGLDHGRWT